MKINNLCKLHKITKHGIRYYERLGLITPKRKNNGYREYLSKDIKTLSAIMLFRYFRLPLSTIKSLLNERNIDQTIQALSQELRSIHSEIKNLETKREILQKYVAHLEKTKQINTNKINVIYIKKRYAVVSKYRTTNLDDSFLDSKRLFQKWCGEIPINKFGLTGNFVGQEDGSFNYQSFFLIDNKNNTKSRSIATIPEGIYVTMTLNEPFDRKRIANRLKEFAEHNGYEVSNTCLEFYLVTFYESSDSTTHLTRLELNVQEKNN
ncbi:hypothetical protein A5844_001068 [Enterococcus sp. 10A9_DIV0425]|uniref:HTH merR-type domain-containing protein n=1 Tax=Candidatus Enterococcus wittei TaxID=1987383 RepID=A0A242K0Y5_9ENTE|nr:MerR family transcriptional regulator [Enterococcus sp. 10A9_DIV0425]OTP10934.1 hypothetical protein A5844_001068 [Enterococcus sp. 10A9_DIV0425]THE16297.1 MerR family transcriptional regulator [Enterococcus hirae]